MVDDNFQQLLMHVSGEGGVGKSKVIRIITILFNNKQAGHWLAKASLVLLRR